MARSKSPIFSPSSEVAHRAADEARLLALAVERAQRAREPPLVEQAPIGEAPVANGGQTAHSKCPGTSTPFSTCGGHVDAVAARGGRDQHDHADQRRRQADEDERRDPAARPMLDRERIARAQDEIDREKQERGQEQSEGLDGGAPHQENSLS